MGNGERTLRSARCRMERIVGDGGKYEAGFVRTPPRNTDRDPRPMVTPDRGRQMSTSGTGTRDDA